MGGLVLPSAAFALHPAAISDGPFHWRHHPTVHLMANPFTSFRWGFHAQTLPLSRSLLLPGAVSCTRAAMKQPANLRPRDAAPSAIAAAAGDVRWRLCRDTFAVGPRLYQASVATSVCRPLQPLAPPFPLVTNSSLTPRVFTPLRRAGAVVGGATRRNRTRRSLLPRPGGLSTPSLEVDCTASHGGSRGVL